MTRIEAIQAELKRAGARAFIEARLAAFDVRPLLENVRAAPKPDGTCHCSRKKHAR